MLMELGEFPDYLDPENGPVTERDKVPGKQVWKFIHTGLVENEGVEESIQNRRDNFVSALAE